jgi:molybdate transport system ATP-binding protein
MEAMSIEARFRLTRGEFVLDAEFTAPASGVTALFGPSASGKTTLLRSIAGLEPCRNGMLRVGGTTWQDQKHFVPPHRRALAYVFQDSNLFPHLSVRANLEYGYRRVPSADRRIEFDEVTGLLALEPLLPRGIGRLSGGERQRVAIGRALLASPRLLLLDEPLAALDQASRNEILPYLDSLHERLALPLIYVSHSTDEVARLADHMLLMETGRIVASGPVRELLTRTDLSLAHGDTAESIIEATVSGHDEEFQLSSLEFAGTDIWVPRPDLPVGRRIRLRVLARDVSLTAEPPRLSSILNIIPVEVESLADEGPAQTMVRLRTGKDILLARITRRSVARLGLSPGAHTFAQIKSVAVLD